MRIYAVADIHGRLDKFELIRNNISKFKPDVLVAAGDITHFTKPDRSIAQMGNLPVSVLAVRGNTDRPVVESLCEKYPTISLLHLREIVVRNVRFTGISGTVLLPFRSKVRFREKLTVSRVAPLVNEGTVFVAHPPPRGALDKVLGKFHAGSGGLRELILKKQPALFICCHIHENPGQMYLGKTLVVNCNIRREGQQGAIIDFTGEGKPQVTMLQDNTMPA